MPIIISSGPRLLSGRTQLVGIIGYPVAHSLSPRMHNAAFAADGLDYVYVPMQVHPSRLPEAVEGLRALGFRGFNITMPHKQAIVSLLDEMDTTARLANAVNTVVIDDGRMKGANTDGAGFVQACKEAGTELNGKKVLILGAGGAAAAIAVEVLREGISSLYLVNRSYGRAENLSRALKNIDAGFRIEVHPIDVLPQISGEADIVINATYLGMHEGDPLPIPLQSLREGNTVGDAVYLQGCETELIRRAREQGARVVPGASMLLHQGVEAQSMWTGRRPNVEVMRSAIS